MPFGPAESMASILLRMCCLLAGEFSTRQNPFSAVFHGSMNLTFLLHAQIMYCRPMEQTGDMRDPVIFESKLYLILTPTNKNFQNTCIGVIALDSNQILGVPRWEEQHTPNQENESQRSWNMIVLTNKTARSDASGWCPCPSNLQHACTYIIKDVLWGSVETYRS